MTEPKPRQKPHSRRKGEKPVRHKADRGPGVRLTFADRYQLLELHRANPQWSYRELASQAGVNEETARLTCIAAGKNAADLMGAYAEPMLRNWIKASRTASTRGDHRPSRDWLLHAGSIEPLPDTQRGSGPAVVIINSPLPGMPGNPLIVGSQVLGTPIGASKLAPADGEPPDRDRDREP